MKVLIATPFFSNLGGSELETIFIANYYASLKEVEQVDIYVAFNFNLNFTRTIYINKKVNIFNKPKLFNYRIIKQLNYGLKNKLKLEVTPIETVYWKILLSNKKYKTIYILTKTTLNYFVPVIKYSHKKNEIYTKYTTILYKDLKEVSARYLSQINKNIVTSAKQVSFFKNRLELTNVIEQETLIYKEDELLKRNKKIGKFRRYNFGVFSRISKEKQIEDSIQLIYNLKLENHYATLLIRGKGNDEKYYDKLKKLIIELDLTDVVFFEFESVPYDKVHTFFERVNCVLITSFFEAGPTVAIEAMAFGIPVLSYDVGAMRDRLKEFPELIAYNSKEFTEKAINLFLLKEEDYKVMCNQIQEYYKKNLSNTSVENFLKETLQ